MTHYRIEDKNKVLSPEDKFMLNLTEDDYETIEYLDHNRIKYSIVQENYLNTGEFEIYLPATIIIKGHD